MKNVNFITNGAGACGVLYFNTKGTIVLRREGDAVKDGIWTDGVLTQFTTEDYAYMRILSCGFDETSIITINEPIE